jgi:hypothetical protein
LGFLTTPVNIHYNSDDRGNLTRSGTANRLSTFSLGYIEILGAVAETPLADQLRTALSRYSGLHLLAFTHADAVSQKSRLEKSGFPMQPAVRLRRPIQTGDGEQTVQVSVIRTEPGVMAEARVQMLTHETPELIWLPEYSTHPNRTDALSDLLLISDDAPQKAERYSRFTDCPLSRNADLNILSLSRGSLTFATPKAAETFLPRIQIPDLPYMAAVVLRSGDLAETRGVLEAHGVKPLRESDKIIVVGPEDAAGAYMIFHAPNIESIWSCLAGEHS